MRYDSAVVLNCYEGEDEAAVAAAAEAAAAEAAAAEAAKKAAKAGERTFSQAEVNKFVADDRRKTEARLTAEKKLAAEKRAEEYKQLSERASLTEAERDEYRAKHEAAEEELKNFMSEKERLLKEKKDLDTSYQAKLTAAEKAQKDWEQKYVTSNIQRELQDAAVKHGAYNTQQMTLALRPYAKVVEDKVVVDLADVVDGKPVTTTLSPDAAMKRMKELPEMYGNLFKANVVAGVGGNSSTGGSTTKVDPKHMTQDQYAEMRKKLLA